MSLQRLLDRRGQYLLVVGAADPAGEGDLENSRLVDASGADAVSTGARVRIRWSDERQGLLGDIACFELVEGA